RNVVEKEPHPANEANAAVPAEVGRVIARLMQKEPELRFSSAAEALGELQRARGMSPSGEAAPAIASSPESDLGTISAGSTSKRLEGTTDKVFDDATPAITTQPRGVVPSSISFSIIGVLAAGLFGTIGIIHLQSDPSPTAVMTAQQAATAATKKKALNDARALLA